MLIRVEAITATTRPPARRPRSPTNLPQSPALRNEPGPISLSGPRVRAGQYWLSNFATGRKAVAIHPGGDSGRTSRRTFEPPPGAEISTSYVLTARGSAPLSRTRAGVPLAHWSATWRDAEM